MLFARNVVRVDDLGQDRRDAGGKGECVVDLVGGGHGVLDAVEGDMSKERAGDDGRIVVISVIRCGCRCC